MVIACSEGFSPPKPEALKRLLQALITNPPIHLSQTMTNLPLFTLFNRLRRAGFPLGVDEYMLALRALQGGFGLEDVEALKRLCRTLWVKSPLEERLFEYQFEQMLLVWEEAVISSQVEPEEQLKPSEKVPTKGRANHSIPILLRKIRERQGKQGLLAEEEGMISEEQSDDIPPSPRPSPPFLAAEAATPPPLIEVADETQTVQAIQLAPLEELGELGQMSFHFGHDYLPVGRREMEQSWRYLRFPVREGAAVELDVQATVNQIAADGFLLKPVLMPRRINRAHLLLLLDQKGSMVPFHALSERLRDTALLGGKLGKANVYYFYNFPVDYLYQDRAHLEPQKIDELLPQLNPQRTAILIFSDGGAARGGYNKNRIKRTKTFLERLRTHVQQIAWLNPMPHERWGGSSAGEIADIVPMFEMNRRGLEQAIEVLKGKG